MNDGERRRVVHKHLMHYEDKVGEPARKHMLKLLSKYAACIKSDDEAMGLLGSLIKSSSAVFCYAVRLMHTVESPNCTLQMLIEMHDVGVSGILRENYVMDRDIISEWPIKHSEEGEESNE